jgi:hypothetical protein
LVNESERRIFFSRHLRVLVRLRKDLSPIEINWDLSNNCALIVSFARNRSIIFLDAFFLSKEFVGDGAEDAEKDTARQKLVASLFACSEKKFRCTHMHRFDTHRAPF